MSLSTTVGSDLVAGMIDDMNNQISESADGINSILNIIYQSATTPIEFGFGRAFVSYFQGLALFIAVIIIVINGVSRGYLLNGGTQDMSTGAYIWRSIWPIALIAATPTIVSSLNILIQNMIADLMTASLDHVFDQQYIDAASGVLVENTSFLGAILSLALILVYIYYIITVSFQLLKRQIQLAILGIIAPLVSALTAADSTSGDYLTLLKEMVGIGLITVLQASVLASTIYFACAVHTTFDIFVVIALLAATKQLPSWVQRYTLAPVVSRGDSVFSTVKSTVSSGTRMAINKVIPSRKAGR